MTFYEWGCWFTLLKFALVTADEIIVIEFGEE